MDVPRNALNFLRRVLQPTGCWIAFMGPDGCGKSLVINAVGTEFAPSFRTTRYYHLRPRLIGRKPSQPWTGDRSARTAAPRAQSLPLRR